MNRFNSLSEREQRLVRYAGIGIAIYLALFAGYSGWKHLEKKHMEFQQLVQEARALGKQTLPYQDKVLVVRKMMDDFNLDPAKLKRETVVSEASAAIQKAAKAGGLQLGSIRETAGRGSGMALATVQIESSGPIPASLSFLAGLNRIGFPLVVDSVQFSADNGRPGQVKLNLTILIWDFDQQKAPKEATHA